MIRPARLHSLVSRCHGCHVVTDERLVVDGGHPVPGPFDLVAATQGRIRHNFLRGGESVNDPASPQRRRVLHVLGGLLDAEATLRGLATATEEGELAQALTQRLASVRAGLQSTRSAAAISEVDQALAALGALGARPVGEAAGAAAARVGALARRFAESSDGSELAALDPLLQVRIEPSDGAPAGQ